jgi:hypothetical protein
VKPEHQVVEAPARVFHSQEELNAAFKAGELERDFVAVVRFQGPKANGMPELHKLTPTVLGVLQDRGRKVALVTDGRMSGASGKVPAAIHVTPEAPTAARSPGIEGMATSSASTRRRARLRSRSATASLPAARRRSQTFPTMISAWDGSFSQACACWRREPRTARQLSAAERARQRGYCTEISVRLPAFTVAVASAWPPSFGRRRTTT